MYNDDYNLYKLFITLYEEKSVYKTAEKLFAPKSKSLKHDIKRIDSEKLIQSLKIQKEQIEIIMIAYCTW